MLCTRQLIECGFEEIYQKLEYVMHVSREMICAGYSLITFTKVYKTTRPIIYRDGYVTRDVGEIQLPRPTSSAF